ncbi:flavin reductase [Pantoea sp.]|uniref:flavin reductase n=1 Tax=Pantoea sp. TaxID=69393 RepID=UPI00289EB473|nr:flavin reductase [Pantoea sp.]
MPTELSPAPLAEAITAQHTFRNAMAQLAAAVHVVTTDGRGGKAGFAASAVCSVTDSPPTLLVCLNRGSSAWQATTENARVCINTLSAGQQAVSALFGGKTAMTERFAGVEWLERAGKAPALAGAAMSIDCRIVNATTVGSHDVLFCEVDEIIDNQAGSSLLYFNRQYHSL